jgi:uncharacterized protein
MGNDVITCKLKQDIYFNVNRNSGRWSFSSSPSQEISENRSLSELGEWEDNVKMFVINITDNCNLNCVYCSRQCARKAAHIMPLEKLKKVLHEIENYALEKNVRVTVQFHGGEPLTEFAKIIECIDDLSDGGRKLIHFRIQTNGLLINEKIMEECAKRDIEVGISLDGRKIENDLSRKTVDDRGSFEGILNSLKIIQKYQKEVSCLTVVTNINVDNLDKILEFFGSLGLNNIGFLPLYEEPTTRTIEKKIVPDMKSLADNQKILFDKWIELLKKSENKNLNITTFQILIWNLLAANSPVKKFRTNCAVGVNSFFVEDDGSLWGCGAFSYAQRLKIGDLINEDIESSQKSEGYMEFKNRITGNTKKCNDCPYQFICKGGCIANGFRQEKNLYGTDIWCDYWKEIINHILIRIAENPEIIKLIPNYNIRKKND